MRVSMPEPGNSDFRFLCKEYWRLFGDRKFLWLAGLVLLSMLVRILFIFSKMDFLNSDEAIIGIMAKDILSGKIILFYYGQNYYVPWESYLAAPIIKLFGFNFITLRIIPVILSGALTVVFYFLGEQIGGKKVGLWSALISFIPPVAFLDRQVKADAAFSIVLLFGTLSLLIFIKYLESPRKIHLMLIGALFFFGLSSHPIMGYYIITFPVVLIIRWFSKNTFGGTPADRKTYYIVFTAGILIITGILFDKKICGYFTSFWLFIKSSIPILFGFYSPASFSSFQSHIMVSLASKYYMTVFLSIVIIGIVFYSIVSKWENPGVLVLASFASILILVFVTFTSAVRLTPDVYTNIRFIFPVYSAIPLMIYGIYQNPVNRFLPAEIIISLMLIVNIVGIINVSPGLDYQRELSDFLISNDIEAVYINYYDGYRLAGQTDEKLKPYIIGYGLTEGFNRVERYKEFVIKAGNPAYVFVSESDVEKFEEYLTAQNVSYVKQKVARWTVFLDLNQKIPFQELDDS